jgi:hypothetical protein
LRGPLQGQWKLGKRALPPGPKPCLTPRMTNRLYYGDNLEVLRDAAQFPDECVDLIYLDHS